jgi:hypothetical protein
MTTVVVNVVEKRHGMMYPAHLPSEAERLRMVDLAHQMVCERRLSYRQAQLKLQEYGIVRSIGWLHKTIKLWECPACAVEPEPEPEPADRPPGRPNVRQGGFGGFLTDGLRLEDE